MLDRESHQHRPIALAQGLDHRPVLVASLAQQVRIGDAVGADRVGEPRVMRDHLDQPRVAARVGRDARARVGDRVDIRIDLSAIRFFDVATTRAVAPQPAGAA